MLLTIILKFLLMLLFKDLSTEVEFRSMGTNRGNITGVISSESICQW